MNQESLGKTQDLKRIQERKVVLASPPQAPVPAGVECRESACELQWKPVKRVNN